MVKKRHKMTDLFLTRSQARRFLLACQNLWPPRSLQGKAGALDFIRRVGCVQFDPLDVAGKNAELVLQSRVADFTPAMLDEMLYRDRKLVDGWDKQMAIYPVEDWPYFRRRRESVLRQLRSQEAVRAIAPTIRAAIEQRGPLTSSDLEHNHKVDWWWGPTSLARAALESMYFGGELVIHHKVHTRKVYDLAERHIPAELLDAPEPNPSDEDYHDWYALRRLGAVGMLWERTCQAWRQGTPFDSKQRLASLQRLLARGEVLRAQVEGFDVPFYLLSRDQALLEPILRDDPSPAQAAFLAPLDNLIWDRPILEELFGFYYRWEVYTPAERREYGYYVLPVLYGERLVARFEPVRQKKDATLTIKNWWWETGVTPDEALFAALDKALQCFGRYLGAKRLVLEGNTPARLGT